MIEEGKYADCVIKAIADYKQSNVSEIKLLDCIYSSQFNKDHYLAVFNLLKENKASSFPESLEFAKREFGEYLYVFSFLYQESQKYFVTIYDSDELWQDPEVIDIIKAV